MYTTIFYSKTTGKIGVNCTTEVPQDMDYFGDSRVDYEQIYDFLTFEHNPQIEMVTRNKELFYVDLETKEIAQKNFTLELKQK